eukprot:9497254-Pyramimonas_sp.AAC.1
MSWKFVRLGAFAPPPPNGGLLHRMLAGICPTTPPPPTRHAGFWPGSCWCTNNYLAAAHSDCIFI